MTEAKAVHCDGPDCGEWAPVRPPKQHPEDWFLVFGPTGRLDFCSRACVSQWFRPWAGQASTTITGGGGGGSSSATYTGGGGAGGYISLPLRRAQ